MATAQTTKILYIGNDPASAALLRSWLTRSIPGCRTICSTDPVAAIDSAKNQAFDLYLFESTIGDKTGVELCVELRGIDPNAAVIICTSARNDAERDEALRAGAAAYLVKEDEFYRLSAIVRRYAGSLSSCGNRLFRRVRRSAAII
jgi:DNA-binding NarL/FixJ family response regulator